MIIEKTQDGKVVDCYNSYKTTPKHMVVLLHKRFDPENIYVCKVATGKYDIKLMFNDSKNTIYKITDIAKINRANL